MTTVTTSTPSPIKKRPVMAAGAALLALAASSIGIWQIGQHGGGPGSVAGRAGETAAPAVVRAAEGAPASDQEMYQQRRQGASDATRPNEAGGADRRLTIFLVGSREHAEQVRAALDQRDEILSQAGQALPAEEIMVVGSTAEELRLREGIYESDGIRASMHLPPATVIDLRGR